MKKFTILAILLLGFALGAQAQSASATSSEATSDLGNASISGGNNSHLLLEDDGRVYPNPTNDGKFNVSLPGGADHFEVFNTLGQLILPPVTPRGDGHTYTVDMNGFTPGIYFVRIYANGHTIIKRVVVR